MTHFLFAFNALTPLLLLAFLGYTLKRLNIVNATFISQLNKYVFYVALPVLIVTTLASTGDLSQLDWPVVWFAILMILIIIILAYYFVKYFKTDNAYRPVLMQAFFRGNFTLIGIPLAIRLGGDETLNMIIILNAFIIPITNFFSILTFKIWQSELLLNKESLKDLFKSTVTNPLMIAIFIGFLAFIFQAQYNAFLATFVVIDETLSFIDSTATPMALIAIGGQFEVRRIKHIRKPLIAGIIGRLMVVPVLTFSLAYLLHTFIPFSDSWAALIAIFASPVAVSSVAITKGLQGDDAFASQMVIWTTALAVFTLFVIVIIFRILGLL